jgi:hypothetical protein
LETLLPWQRRARVWRDLGRHMNRRLPGLEYRRPPVEIATVGDLARRLAPEKISDLWETYRQIVAEQLGLGIDDITPEASFVDDLRAD